MSIMSMKNVRNNPSRNGFDLSTKVAFTAKAGELLPVFCKEVLPGDRFEIKPEWFTRTQPVNTAAYTRIREYYDFFFVPSRLLWRYFPQFVTNMNDNSQSASNSIYDYSISKYQPWFNVKDIYDYLHARGVSSAGDTKKTAGELTCKLLNYLGYGSIESFYKCLDQSVGAYSDVFADNAVLNPFPLLAYQKIYQDYYRFTQWEKTNPQAFNVDYLGAAANGTNPETSHIDFETMNASSPLFSENFLTLRYCNWNKDYFTGLLPNSQFGDAAVASPITGVLTASNSNIYFASEPVNGTNTGVALNLNISPSNSQVLNTAGLSALALRQAEFMQKYKEIAQSGGQDYKSQVKKLFGVDVPTVHSSLCHFLGSVVGNLDISEVVNNNITGDNESLIAGKGVGSGRGTISFDNSKDDYGNEHGYLLCIYHALPLLDYVNYGIDRVNLKNTSSDYANPVFDRIGMVSVPAIELDNTQNSSKDKDVSRSLGYAPRYIDYKTSTDKIKGAFEKTLSNWVTPIKFSVNGPLDNPTVWSYLNFKVSPSVLNSIFVAEATSNVDSDQFLCNANFDIKAVRNLDVDGLPY